MGKKFTTGDLLDSIKSRILVPTNQNTFTDAQLLMLADEELQTFIVPMLLDVREDYLQARQVVSLSNQTGNGEFVISIPERAVGNKLSDLTIRDSSGNERSIPKYSRSDSHGDLLGYNQQSTNNGFSIQGNNVYLASTYGANSSAVLYYPQRPNSLIETDQAGLITAINSSAREITVSSLPSGFAVGEEVDLISASAPYDNLAIDVVISNVSGTTVTVESLPTNSSTGAMLLEVGDYICLAGESPVVQVPTELYPVLAQAVVTQVTEALGDNNGVVNSERKLERMMKKAITLISPRVEGERKIVLARNNIFSYMARRTRWRW